MPPPAFRITRRLRHVVSLLLVAVLVLSPVLSTAAQTHEAAHAAQGDLHFHAHDHARETHSAAPHGAIVHDEADHDDDMPDAGGVLHGLAHAAHACGHSVAILGAALTAPCSDGATVVLADLITTSIDAPRAHPFRPPIA